MKKSIIVLLLFFMTTLIGCSTNISDEHIDNNNVTNYIDKFVELEKYIFEVEEYKTLDYDFANNFFEKINDNWSGGCSAVSKMVDGHRLVGRNMDLNVTNKNAYIIRTDAGKYRTVGLVYTFRDFSPDYDDVYSKGFPEDFYKALPFMCDDVLNDAGLFIEVNMRHGEYWPNGEDKYACSGTNPESADRIYMFELPRYIGENCSTVKEAKDYISSLNIYSKNNDWNYCFLISDAVGDSSLLEFSKNEVYWIDEDKLDEYDWLNSYNTKAIAQTNFYLNQDSWNTQDIKTGEGRFIALQNGISDVNSRSDMYELMKKVQYTNYYLDYDECKNNYFDPRSDILAEVGHFTYDFVMNPSNEDYIKSIFNSINPEIRNLSRQENQDLGLYWESSFTEVIDTTTKEIFVRFFENEDIEYLIDFDSTKKLNNISEWN